MNVRGHGNIKEEEEPTKTVNGFINVSQTLGWQRHPISLIVSIFFLSFPQGSEDDGRLNYIRSTVAGRVG